MFGSSYYDKIRHVCGDDLYLLADSGIKSGTTIPDFSGKTGDMSLNGNPTIDSQLTPYGKSSILYDGDTDSIDLNGTNINSYFDGETFTCGVWIDPTFDWGSANVRTIFELSTTGNERLRFFKPTGLNRLTWLVVGNDASETSLIVTGLSFTTWYFCVVDYRESDGDMNMYLYNASDLSLTSGNDNYAGSWNNNTLNLTGNTALFGRNSTSVNFEGYGGAIFLANKILTSDQREYLARI